MPDVEKRRAAQKQCGGKAGRQNLEGAKLTCYVSLRLGGDCPVGVCGALGIKASGCAKVWASYQGRALATCIFFWTWASAA